MKYKLILFLLVIVSFVACKTTPKAVDSIVEKSNNNEDNEVVDKLVKEAEKARKEAIENGADKSRREVASCKRSLHQG